MSSTLSSTNIAPSQLEAGPEKKDDFMIVDWDGPEDRENPRNWSPRKRWGHGVIISILALIKYFSVLPASITLSLIPCIHQFLFAFCDKRLLIIEKATWPQQCVHPGPRISPLISTHITSTVVGTLTVTLYVFGIAIGPMFMSPLSEMYGRVPVYHAATTIFVAFIIGGTPMALGGRTIADITSVQQRALAMALFSMGPLAGPVLVPVIGGFVAAGKGWRWTFWLLAILGGFFGSTTVLILRETHPKVLLERKAAYLRACTGNSNWRSKLDSTLSPRQVLLQILVRPMMLLVRSPILFVISLYVALVFADGVQQLHPEYRLLLMIWFSPFVAGGLFLYGWTAYYKVYWFVPILGTSLMGFGAFFVITPAQLYLIDVFESEAAASALGANNLLRYISSTFLPLAGPAMYRSLNYGWGNSLLGFIALAFVPAPVLFYKYGEQLRTKASAWID
ncbi:unnamed protein product [Penicillium nalgiovense]|nr:unnamed protein product [Penicillium nalgiovense]